MKYDIQLQLSTARENYTFAPARILDTEVSVDDTSVDVLLTPEAAAQIAADGEAMRTTWEALYANSELTNQEREIVHRRLAEISLALCAAEQVLMDSDTSEEIESIEAELYDYYDPNLFRHAVSVNKAKIESLTLPEELHALRDSVVGELAQYTSDDLEVNIGMPTEETLTQVQEWLFDQYGDILDEVDQDGRAEHDAASIVSYFQKAIDSTPVLRQAGWQAEVIERKKDSASVLPSDKKAVVPSQRKASPAALKKLLIHEALGHGLRSALAEQHGISIGQHGTATYTRFEESMMIALEQCLEEKYDPMRGSEHYVAVGLTVTEGLTREHISKLLHDMALLNAASKEGTTLETAYSQATQRAVAYTRRTFAGMTDVDDGIAHRKDIDYFHGLNDTWRLLNFAVEHEVLDDTLRWMLSAKFNPFSDSDREYVNGYVQMPPQLESLFSKAS